jgi:hypothetical protein
MPSDEDQAQQSTLQRSETWMQVFVRGDNSTVVAGPGTPTLLRLNSFSDLSTILGHGYTHVLLVFVPAGIVAGALGLPAEVVFWLNFLGVIPLALLMTVSVLKLSANSGPVRGGLLKAVFGNTMEMIVSVLYPAAFMASLLSSNSLISPRFASLP